MPPHTPDPRPILAEVVLLAGPSGCGKTHLAQAVGLPIVALDDFYRDGTEPDLPRTDEGIVDWEDPRSWNPDAAVAALAELCRAEEVEVPRYAFGEDRVVGHHTLSRDGSRIVVAEGIFAAELVARLRAEGLLADALLVRQNRWVTFARRLVRDVREGRKAPWYLVRQGWAKTRAEHEVVAHQCRRGARPVSKPEARARLIGLAGRTPVAAAVPPASVDRAVGAA